MLKKIDTPISDLFIIIPDNFKDARGYFFEAYSEKKYHALGLTYKFVQDNISKSVYGTVRGLHYQVGDFAQGKLCQVILGKVLDVAVDIRFGSPTFGKYFSVELSAENNKQLWIPLVLRTDFQYYRKKLFFIISVLIIIARKMKDVLFTMIRVLV